MLSAIDRRPELKDKVGLKALMDTHGKFFHALTHGEMPQLRRRYGTTGSSFSEEENKMILGVADLFALLGASVLVKATQQSLEQFLGSRTDDLVAELRAATGEAIPQWKGWKPLPEPTVFPGRIPLHKNDLGPPKGA